MPEPAGIIQGERPPALTETAPAVVGRKWPTLLLLCLVELLAVAVWFSATAVVPALSDAWRLSDSGRAWLTMSVQIGFVVGALFSALFNLADRIHSRHLLPASALLAGLVTALIPAVASGLAVALPLRFLSGAFLAGVYPVGMKIMATWTRRDRGLAIGLMVGALAVGSASPHLIKGLGGIGGPWRPVMYLAALSAISAALIAGLFIREGPYATATPRFDPRQVALIARDRPLLLANLGYLGHMWELYAMWVWLPSFLLASFALRGLSASAASMVAFAAIAAGGVGSVAAGLLADRFGRTVVTSVSLVISALCALAIGFLFGGSPAWLTIVALIWGLAIVADSAQYSAAVTELAEGAYVGTALTLQTSLGFLLTLVTIRLVPVVEAAVGWRYAFSFLALGPAVGLWAMMVLRRSPAARKMAGGRG